MAQEIDNVKPAMDHLAKTIAEAVMNAEKVPMDSALCLQALALYRLDDAGLAVFIDDEEDDE